MGIRSGKKFPYSKYYLLGCYITHGNLKKYRFYYLGWQGDSLERKRSFSIGIHENFCDWISRNTQNRRFYLRNGYSPLCCDLFRASFSLTDRVSAWIGTTLLHHQLHSANLLYYWDRSQAFRLWLSLPNRVHQCLRLSHRHCLLRHAHTRLESEGCGYFKSAETNQGHY